MHKVILALAATIGLATPAIATDSPSTIYSTRGDFKVFTMPGATCALSVENDRAGLIISYDALSKSILWVATNKSIAFEDSKKYSVVVSLDDKSLTPRDAIGIAGIGKDNKETAIAFDAGDVEKEYTSLIAADSVGVALVDGRRIASLSADGDFKSSLNDVLECAIAKKREESAKTPKK